MTELTVIITGLNERFEVENTLKSIRSTANNVDIIYIDDCGADDYDYKGVCEKYDCRYIRNENRMGVSESRNKGVRECKTQYFVILDSHMRFYENAWDERLLGYLKDNPQSIICTKTAIMNLSEDGKTIIGEDGSKKSDVYGAYLDTRNDGWWFSPKWSYYYYEDKGNHLKSVPCVLGAVYASNKDWWKLIWGINGLIKWGSDEANMSIKTWLAGGECLCIDDMYVGHLYRPSNPNPVSRREIERNELYLAHMFYRTDEELSKYEESLEKRLGTENFKIVKTLYEKSSKEIKPFHDYFYNGIAKRDFNFFLKINESVIKKSQLPTS